MARQHRASTSPTRHAHTRTRRSTGRRAGSDQPRSLSTRGVRAVAKCGGRLGRTPPPRAWTWLASAPTRRAWAAPRPPGGRRGATGVRARAPIAYFVRARWCGHERFAQLTGPAVLVASHSSHLHTPAILRALPVAWCWCTVVAVAADHFEPAPLGGVRRRLACSRPSAVHGRRRRGRQTHRGARPDWPEPADLRGRHPLTRRSVAARTRRRAGRATRPDPDRPRARDGTHAAMPRSVSWPHRIKGRCSAAAIRSRSPSARWSHRRPTRRRAQLMACVSASQPPPRTIRVPTAIPDPTTEIVVSPVRVRVSPLKRRNPAWLRDLLSRGVLATRTSCTTRGCRDVRGSAGRPGTSPGGPCGRALVASARNKPIAARRPLGVPSADARGGVQPLTPGT